MSSIEVPSGYADTDDYIGVAHRQHDLSLVTVQVPWLSLIKMVKLPDPGVESEFNRPLKKGHAERFGEYLDVVTVPYTPPIALWTDPSNIQLVEIPQLPRIGNIRFVIAKFVRSARDQVRILDGQHRIFGCHTQAEKYQHEIARAQDNLSRARQLGQRELIADAEARLRRAKEKLPRLQDMVVTVQVALTDSKQLAKQVFADVADNALGISRSILSEFSERSAFNRVAQRVSADTLPGLIDTIQDRMSRKNPHWLSLKDVVNTVQALELALGRRWTHKLEGKINEKALLRRTTAFFEGLFATFPELKSVQTGEVPAAELRAGGSQVNLLGSATMVRVLATAYRTLAEGEGDGDPRPMSHEDIFAFLGTLPIAAGTDADGALLLAPLWVETKAFQEPWTAPQASMGHMRTLSEQIVHWAREAHA